MFLKLYLPEDMLAVLLDISKGTLRKWTWIYIENLALLLTSIIDFSKRNRNCPKDAWTRMSVDGTDFKTQEIHPKNPKMISPKYNGSALKYEVGISIYSGDIVWVYGPHVQ